MLPSSVEVTLSVYLFANSFRKLLHRVLWHLNLYHQNNAGSVPPEASLLSQDLIFTYLAGEEGFEPS